MSGYDRLDRARRHKPFKSEPLPVPKLSHKEVWDLKEKVVAEWSAYLQSDYGIPRSRANQLASRAWDRIEVRPTALGPEVTFRDFRGVERSALSDANLRSMANQIEYEARMQVERESPPPPPTAAELREKNASEVRRSISI